MTVDELLAREAIRATLASYHMAGDRGRAAELAAVFTVDGTLDTGHDVYVGRAAIAAGIAGVEVRVEPGASPGFVRHHLTTSHLELAGPTEAHGWHYFLVITPVGVDHAGRYVDRYVIEDGRWLIAHRRVVVEWVDEHSAMATSSDAES